jgi:multidrug efflux pump subunit AcrA (membrane-fusion protein)
MKTPGTISEASNRTSEQLSVSREAWNSTPDVPLKKERPHILKQIRWALFGIVIALPIVGGIFGIRALQSKEIAAARQVMPPETVNAIAVIEEQWQPRVSSVGSVAAFQGTVVRTEAEGTIRELKFEAGSVVKAGDELLQLDVEIERAQLRAAEATAEWARISFNRAKDLIGSRSISRAELDSADANLKQADAQVDNIRAVMAKKLCARHSPANLASATSALGSSSKKAVRWFRSRRLIPCMSSSHCRSNCSVIFPKD